jgi:hypothetical protein
LGKPHPLPDRNPRPDGRTPHWRHTLDGMNRRPLLVMQAQYDDESDAEANFGRLVRAAPPSLPSLVLAPPTPPPALLQPAAAAWVTPPGRARGAWTTGSVYDSTFSRTVWRLYGGAKGLVMRQNDAASRFPSKFFVVVRNEDGNFGTQRPGVVAGFVLRWVAAKVYTTSRDL